MSPAGRYRRVRSRLWCDPLFVALGEGEKLTALYLLSGPPTTATGLFRLSIAAAAEDLACSVSTFRRRMDAVLGSFGWRHDPRTKVVWIPEWAEENPPANPNVAASWRTAFDEIPDCALKAEASAAVRAFLKNKGEAFGKAFDEPSRNGLANAPVPVPEVVTIPRFGATQRRVADAAQHRHMVDRVRDLHEQKTAGIEQAASRRRDAS